MMKVILIAAGMGTRLLHLTKDMPKCKVHVRGKPIIEHALDIFKELGMTDISIVKGFMKEQINYPGTKAYYNDDYHRNNILASLFYAEKELNDDVIVLYSDILFEKNVVEKLLAAEGDINVVVDEDWLQNYVDRKLHPVEQAENVYCSNNTIQKIGKHLTAAESNGEFIGMAKFTKKGCEILKQTYHDVVEKYKERPFQKAQSVSKAYLTDIFQELIDRGYNVNPVVINGGWREIDTIEDLKKAGGTITTAKVTPEHRRGLLKQKLNGTGFIRVIEAHSGISAIVANNAILSEKKVAFDALWISSLTESAVKGQPDIEIMGMDSRLHTVSQIMEATNMPIIIDGDTGGDPNAFEYFIQKAESLGASAIIIEDKIYPKKNSLDAESDQTQEDPRVFANKIRRGKHALLTNDFLIIARIESLIAGKSVDDAIERARHYLEAGADGIMIHSKSKSPQEVMEFAQRYHQLTKEIGITKPLVCVPTTYNTMTELELQNAGFNVVIHANHLMRATIRAMQAVCKSILLHGRSLEAEEHCSSVDEIFDLVGFSDIKNKEKRFNGGLSK
ncbi:MAG: phosphoenolpyruvate mutase [Nanoarchaeota archaeon]|nr:phosphoenolpyruvate mutase [Nanoarchaeota archaeon]